MKKIVYFLYASLALVGCSDHTNEVSDYSIPLDKEAIEAKAKEIFGEIDNQQTWSSINRGSVTITPNADLENIVKVQILTESPFGNPNAMILNEANVVDGQPITLVYDAPNVYNVLYAACVSEDGKYFVTPFELTDTNIDFEGAAAARMTRGEVAAETYPEVSSIVLGDSAKSFNALRAEASIANGYVVVNDNSNKARKYTDWADGSWKDDYLWAPVDNTNNGWTIKNGTIYKTINEKVDMTTMQWLVRFYLPKKDENNNKYNNWKSIVEGTNYFKEYKNHFVSDGTPLTITPLQMNTTEGQYNNIYYYYFNPQKIEGMNDKDVADFIKKLPKFKAVVGYNSGDAFKREKKYLLPYYGDDAITAGTTPDSLNIPAGYYIGFLNQKANGNSYSNCMNGCTYGYGPLNIENNHLIGHYFSAMSTEISQLSEFASGAMETNYGKTPSGMEWDSPRIGIFSANYKTYLCFEDGSDCNFSDMIIEITSGVEALDPVKPAEVSYIMCFEDEPEIADYDMNDVVLRGVRLNEDQIQISLIACGAYDELQIKGLQNTNKLGKNNTEVHRLFGVKAEDKVFINTQKGDEYKQPVSEIFNIDKSISIEDFMSKITIKNLTTGKTIGMPKTGEAPYAIIVPLNFRYPVERCSIVKAYPNFKKWAQNRNEATDWYLYPVENDVYPDKFAEAE